MNTSCSGPITPQDAHALSHRRAPCCTLHPPQVLVLEHLSGGELLDHLASGAATCEAHLAALFRQVAAGLAYMHSLDIMHRWAGGGQCALL